MNNLAHSAMRGTSYYPALINLLIIIAFTVVSWIAAISLHSRTLPKGI